MSLCLLVIFKNESHIMKEFITHYLNQGVDHFIMIDNGSNDNYMEHLLPYNCIDVVIDPEKYAQVKSYNKCKEKCKQYDWVIVCDMDEFIYARKGYKTIKDYLHSLHDSISQVLIPWKIFGSNGYNTMDQSQPSSVVKTFTKRMNYDKQDNFQGVIIQNNNKYDLVKSIVKTKELIKFDMHSHITNKIMISADNNSDFIINNQFSKIDETILECSYLHLNHYVIQSFEWFMRIKTTRGDADNIINDHVRDETYFHNFDKSCNDIIDLELSTINNNIDYIYYLDKYPDLIQSGICTEKTAIDHWNNYGKKEGRSPFFCFDWNYYLDTYPDLRNAGIVTKEQALNHWNNHGKKEGRESYTINISSTIRKTDFTIDDFNAYMKKYDSLEHVVVYHFYVGSGGIGDCTFFFMQLLYFCMQYDIKLHYQVNNIVLEKYLKLKYEKMYIGDHNYKKISPPLFYNTYSYDDIKIPIQELFYFTEDVKVNSNKLLQIDNYVSIHLRLGDSYLEIDHEKNPVNPDKREYDETKLYEYIETNKDEKIVFFCDNKTYKQKIKDKYTIFITSSSIGHTSIEYTTDDQILDAISEFYLIAQSKKIISASKSGFSIMASKYKNIPVIQLY